MKTLTKILFLLSILIIGYSCGGDSIDEPIPESKNIVTNNCEDPYICEFINIEISEIISSENINGGGIKYLIIFINNRNIEIIDYNALELLSDNKKGKTILKSKYNSYSNIYTITLSDNTELHYNK